MIEKILFFIFFVSSYGMYQIENGAYAPSISVNGYENGALPVYVLFWLLFFITFHVVKNRKISLPVESINKKYEFIEYARQHIIINMIFLFIIVFAFGGYQVWFGEMGKGEFRSSGLGPFGAIAYGISKFGAPALSTFLSYLYTKLDKKTLKDKLYLFLNFSTVFILGSAWGGKSFSVFLLLPALTILYWNLSIVRFAVMTTAALFIMVLFSLLYDTMYSTDTASAIDFVIERLTVMQAEVPWEIWNLHKAQTLNIDYIRTLIPFVGDTTLGLVIDLSPANMIEYISYHYGQILTYTVYPYPEIILAGHNVTGTFFSEALIALGDLGLVVFPLLGGIIVGVIYNTATICFIKNNPVKLSLLLVFFYSIIYPWISSGGLIAIIHISNLFNFSITYLILKLPLFTFGGKSMSLQRTAKA